MTCRALFLLFPLMVAFGQSPTLVSVQKIWDQGPHNAFTDLIRYRDEWFCAFRESDAHVGGNGGLRVLVSADGDHWKSAALVTEAGVDLRDPKLSISPDGRLMILAGGSIYVGQAGGLSYKGRQSRVAFSRDGRRWTAPRKILASGDWLWRVTWHRHRAYGVSYLGTGTGPRSGVLYTSRDGLLYTRVVDLDVPGVAEVTVRFLPDHTMVALARREIDPRHGWIGTSRPPYTQWTWTEIPHRLGGPNFLVLPDGSLVAAGRAHTPSGPTTVVARMTTKSYEPVLSLPSGGDTSYPGMVFRDGLLWMSYYSSHEGKSSIYLAKIRLP
jgi:hypothetical protein